MNAELVRVDELELTEAINNIVQKVWTTKELPQEWEEGALCPVHKKGNQLECRNYRGITLLTSSYKIFSDLQYEQLQP
jgi:hypothetical protein